MRSDQFKFNMEQDNTIIIGFGGDTMLGRGVNEKLSTENYKYPWGDVLPLLKNNDLNIVNLETTLTTSKSKVEKVFNFKADPDRVKVLEEGNIGIVNLANNHILDFDIEGMAETIEVLDHAGIEHTGAGNNIFEATRPVMVNVKGLKIGILGYTDNEPDWSAKNGPGTNYIKVGNITKVKREVASIRNKVDILIVSIHWGPNMREKPSPDYVKFAHQIIDLGVDIIHGHSAHIFQGVEIYKNGLIMYDTGEFVDDYAVDPRLRNDRSFIFICKVNKNGVIELELIPTFISNMQVNLANEENRNWCMERMRALSSKFDTEVTEKGIIKIEAELTNLK